MSENNEKINIVEILMVIKADVSAIKTDMTNFKEIQRTEKDVLTKAINDLRTNYLKDISELQSEMQRELADLNTRIMTKVNNIQSVQNNLVGDVDNLKHGDEAKDARKYRTAVSFILTGLGGMALAKLPDFILWCSKLGNQ